MATRKKGAAGIAPAASPKADALAAAMDDGAIKGIAGEVQEALNPPAVTSAIVLPAEGATNEGDAAIAAAVVFAQQPGQIASALIAPVLETGAAEGGVVSENGLMPDGYPQDIEMGGRIVMVQSRSARGRWRIGRHFTTEPSAVVVNELTEDELGRLLADPELIVSLDD